MINRVIYNLTFDRLKEIIDELMELSDSQVRQHGIKNHLAMSINYRIFKIKNWIYDSKNKL